MKEKFFMQLIIHMFCKLNIKRQHSFECWSNLGLAAEEADRWMEPQWYRPPLERVSVNLEPEDFPQVWSPTITSLNSSCFLLLPLFAPSPFREMSFEWIDSSSDSCPEHSLRRQPKLIPGNSWMI